MKQRGVMKVGSHIRKLCGMACLLLIAAGNAVSAQETTSEESWYSFYDELFEEDSDAEDMGGEQNASGFVEDDNAPEMSNEEDGFDTMEHTDAAVSDMYMPDAGVTDAFAPDSETTDDGVTDTFTPDSDFPDIDAEDMIAQGSAAPDAAAESFASTESAAAPDAYLPIEFVDGISTLTWFPEDASVEEAVQGGQRMIKLCPKDVSEKGNLGVRYGKIAQRDDTWYDLKITVTDFEAENRITKEGEVDVYPTAAFCKTQIAWGRPEAAGKITLKMEFVESGSDKVLPFGGGMQWTITDAFAPVAQGSVSVLQGVRQGALQQTEKTLQVVRREPQVRLFVAEYKRAARQWTQNTVFQVYEWNGHEYAAYRGSLAYDEERKLYVMEHLVRSSLNQGRYKVVRETGGWEQEFLVPDLPVVTDLYYHIET